ncbi:AaceriAFL192Cp [[Ashbya] aceris (nom. inval.)]|nr:AaceriAFL192Cp [[Ashbya] aceris (nom. inval.)]
MGIKERYEAAGQGHLFEHWEQLTTEEQGELEQSLARTDPSRVLASLQRALKSQEKSQEGEISALPETSYESAIDCSAATRARYREIGLEAVRRGEVAVVLMAGGQGTRLGSSQPKGSYDVGLPSHKSLFQIQAERLGRLERLAGCIRPIPWYIMTSRATRAATEQFFSEHRYFGLQEGQVTFFNQGTLPALDSSGRRLLLESKTSLLESPDGNGGLYRALQENGILDDFVSRGIKHIHMYCVDNVLVKLADPVFLGYAIGHGFDLATKVVRKRDAHESVGLIVAKDGKPCVIEYSEISKDLAEAIDGENGLLKLRAANIVNHYYSVNVLREKLESWCEQMPLHIAKKKIKYYDPSSDTLVCPTDVNGIKLEQFIFDVFGSIPLERFGCLEVERSEEFSPLKNGADAPNDNPVTARKAYLELGTKWLRDAGAVIDEGILVEVSSTLSYDGEGLSRYNGQRFSQGGAYLE